MKTIGQVIDELDRKIDCYTALALNPDRDQWLRNKELERRLELIAIRDFINADGTKT